MKNFVLSHPNLTRVTPCIIPNDLHYYSPGTSFLNKVELNKKSLCSFNNCYVNNIQGNSKQSNNDFKINIIQNNNKLQVTNINNTNINNVNNNLYAHNNNNLQLNNNQKNYIQINNSHYKSFTYFSNEKTLNTIYNHKQNLLNFNNNTINYIATNNIELEVFFGRVYFICHNSNSLHNLPIEHMPNALVKLLNSEHFAIIFTSKYIEDYLYLHLFTHRLNSHADLHVLKQEVISNYDIFSRFQKQTITNPVIKIPSNSVIFSDLNNQSLIKYLCKYKNKILNAILENNDYMFDIEDYINEFYLLNINEFC